MKLVTSRHDLTSPRTWRELFMLMGGWVAILAAVGLVLLTAYSVSAYSHAKRLDVSGEWVTAEITDMRKRRRQNATSYYATFQFDIETDRIIDEFSVGESYYRQHRVGQSVDVMYLPENPSVFEHTQGHTSDKALLYQIFALISGVFGTAWLWGQGARTNNAILARRLGKRTSATISSIIESQTKGIPTGRGHMVFLTNDGLEGASLKRKIGELRALGINTEIVVYVRGQDVWWEGDVGPRASIARKLPVVRADPTE